jgi:glycosyltransferase involved in cell wall biosynthesis
MRREKTILSISSTFPRWVDDTVPPFVFLLNAHLKKQGYTIYTLAPHYPGAKFYEEIEGMKIYRFPYFLPLRLQKVSYDGGIMANIKKSTLAKLQVPIFLAMEFAYTAYLTLRFSPSHIHAHWIIPQGLIASLISKIFRTPLITTVHGSDVFIFKEGFMARVARIAIRSSTLVTVNSSASFRALKQIDTKTQAQIIPMGIDPSMFNKSQKSDVLKKELGITGPMLLSIGRVVELKGFRYAILAMTSIVKNYPDAKLVIVGDGPEKDNLQKLVREKGLGNCVIFLGKLSNHELPKYYATADVYIGPSIRTEDGAQEAFGIVFVEALASGAAVVSTNVGGISDIIQNKKTGLVVAEKDSFGVALAVEKILSDNSLKNALRLEGIRSVHENFTWSKIAESFDAGFTKIHP